ncbi:MAG: hypothetical protein Pars2KO_02360 [Parasphingorhabdus sp.]
MKPDMPPRFSFLQRMCTPDTQVQPGGASMAYPLIMLLIFTLFLIPNSARAQDLTTYTSQASYDLALPTTNINSTLEDFSTVFTNTLVSQTTGDNWNGFSVVASGNSTFGTSGYCPSLNNPYASFPTNCMDYSPFAPSNPGIVGAFATAPNGGGNLTFTPDADTIAFAFDHVDWNDLAERSAVQVDLSNGSTIDIVGPPFSLSFSPQGFMGFILSPSAIQSGVRITRVFWYGLESELVGIYNVRTSRMQNDTNLSVSKTSSVWDPDNVGLFNVPGSEVLYRVSVRNEGTGELDGDSLLIIDSLPTELEFWNGDIDDGGPDVYTEVAPIGFLEIAGSGVTFDPVTDLRYSTSVTPPADFDDCSSISLDNNFRSDIRYICIRPTGTLGFGSPSPEISFVLRARIK